MWISAIQVISILIGKKYNIPVRIWIPCGYPGTPESLRPIVFINPAPNMAIANVGYIDSSGKVQLAYLTEWKEVSYRH